MIKKNVILTAASLLTLTTAACDSTTSLCIEEYNCAQNHWCYNGDYDDPSACVDQFYKRYDYCLDKVSETKNTVSATCWEAYEALNSCIYASTSCKSDFAPYVDHMNDLIYYKCQAQGERYVDACGGRFEDLYQWAY